jgi:hypothetical protein
VARATADARGWPWREPVDISSEWSPAGERAWTVRTNAASRGLSVRVTIREADLTVLQAGFLPR